MKTFFTPIFSTVLILTCTLSSAQEELTLAQKLGFAPETKLLIIHADDIGLSQSVNEASIRAYEQKGISSGSLMVP